MKKVAVFGNAGGGKSALMQVRGGKEVTLVPGQTYTVGRNASTTEPAKFIVILLKKGGDVVLPAE